MGGPLTSGSTSGSFFFPLIWNRLLRTLLISETQHKEGGWMDECVWSPACSALGLIKIAVCCLLFGGTKRLTEGGYFFFSLPAPRPLNERDYWEGKGGNPISNRALFSLSLSHNDAREQFRTRTLTTSTRMYFYSLLPSEVKVSE